MPSIEVGHVYADLQYQATIKKAAILARDELLPIVGPLQEVHFCVMVDDINAKLLGVPGSVTGLVDNAADILKARVYLYNESLFAQANMVQSFIQHLPLEVATGFAGQKRPSCRLLTAVWYFHRAKATKDRLLINYLPKAFMDTEKKVDNLLAQVNWQEAGFPQPTIFRKYL